MSEIPEKPTDEIELDSQAPLEADILRLDAETQLNQFVSSEATSNHLESLFSPFPFPLPPFVL